MKIVYDFNAFVISLMNQLKSEQDKDIEIKIELTQDMTLNIEIEGEYDIKAPPIVPTIRS